MYFCVCVCMCVWKEIIAFTQLSITQNKAPSFCSYTRTKQISAHWKFGNICLT